MQLLDSELPTNIKKSLLILLTLSMLALGGDSDQSLNYYPLCQDDMGIHFQIRNDQLGWIELVIKKEILTEKDIRQYDDLQEC